MRPGATLALGRARGLNAAIKAANMRRDPRIALCVDDDQPPFSFVLVEGTVTLGDDLAELRTWAGRIAFQPIVGNNPAIALIALPNLLTRLLRSHILCVNYRLALLG